MNSRSMHYSQSMQATIVDVLIPVVGEDQTVHGVVRLSHQLADVQERFFALRTLIFEVLLAGLALGLGAGIGIAFSLTAPLTRLTAEIAGLIRGEHQAILREEGPTEVRVLLRNFNRLLEHLYALEEARRRLIANLLHELGRPLGAMHAAVQALQQGAAEQHALRQELFGGMATEITSMRHVLDDLTQLREHLIGSLELERKPIALQAWLTSFLQPWGAAAHAQGLNWQVAIPPDLPLLALDADRMAQALGNIISNAINYTPAGGLVSVRAEQRDDQLWLGVSDTGPGMNAATQAHLFEPFYRSPQLRHMTRGLGLGLSIAHDIVTAHQGQIDIHSVAGQGSTFTIRLPLS